MMKKKVKVMNLANKVTMFRLLMIPVFVVSFILMGVTSVVPALIFIIASLSDFVDGYIARKYDMMTTFGKFVDPLVDKVLTQAAFIMLISVNKIPAWIVVVIVARELMITGFRTIAASDGVTIAASKWGKYKTTFQMLAIIMYLLEDNLLANIGFFHNYEVSAVLLYIALAFTIISAVDYLVKNIKVLDLENI